MALIGLLDAAVMEAGGNPARQRRCNEWRKAMKALTSAVGEAGGVGSSPPPGSANSNHFGEDAVFFPLANISFRG
jgi:hypothetical protein